MKRCSNLAIGAIALFSIAAACSDSRSQSADTATDNGQVRDSTDSANVTVTQAPTTTTPPEPTLCIRSNIDFAALRSTPDRGAELLAEIPPGACDVVLLEYDVVSGSGFDWVHVRWNGVEGYTAAGNAQSIPPPPPPTTILFVQDVTDPDFILNLIDTWANSDVGEYDGWYSNDACSLAWGLADSLERGFGDDVDGAIEALEALSIRIPDDVLEDFDRRAAIYRNYGDDIRRIQNTYYDVGADAARADPAYDTVARALVDDYTKRPERYATSLVDDVCKQYQLGD